METQLNKEILPNIEINEIEDEIVEICLKLFDIFSNMDTLKIFIYAKKGIKNSNYAMKELNLTPKRYYSRLRELINIGVLEKRKGIYTYTTLGKILYKLGYLLLEVMKHKEKLRLLTDLPNIDFLSSYEKEKIMEILFNETKDAKLFLEILLENKSNVTIIHKYDALVDLLKEKIKLARNSVLLASRYINGEIIDACLDVVKKDIEFRLILSNEIVFNKLMKLKLLLSPNLLYKILSLMFSSINISKYIKEDHIPFSFCIIDDEHCFFEIPNLSNENFLIAFYISDKQTAGKFKKLFNYLWKTGKEHEIPKLFHDSYIELNNTNNRSQLQQLK